MKIYMWCSCVISILPIACSSSDALPEVDTIHASKDEANNAFQESNKLKDLAGKATVPNTIEDSEATNLLTEEAKQYIGRYRVEIDCTDPFVACSEGTANFIINLLPNGVAHRSIVHMGKITFASSHQYRQDHWSYDAIHHQIILHRESGVQFFYFIDHENNIIMDLDKIAHATAINKKFFNTHPLPKHAYLLKKRSSIS